MKSICKRLFFYESREYKKHEASRQHKDSESANRARKKPNEAPLERAFMSMEKEQQNQMEILFISAYYLVQGERPFRDFTGLMELQEINGLSFGQTYRNDKQCRVFVGFIAEEIRSNLVKQLQEQDFFSVFGQQYRFSSSGRRNGATKVP